MSIPIESGDSTGAFLLRVLKSSAEGLSDIDLLTQMFNVEVAEAPEAAEADQTRRSVAQELAVRLIALSEQTTVTTAIARWAGGRSRSFDSSWPELSASDWCQGLMNLDVTQDSDERNCYTLIATMNAMRNCRQSMGDRDISGMERAMEVTMEQVRRRAECHQLMSTRSS